MAAPTASFAFSPNGLSVDFLDRSAGVINSWSWDFGAAGTSTVQNPTGIVFPLPGIYTVTLIVTNTDGSDSFQFALLLQVTPGLNFTIRQMVEYELPAEIALDDIGFEQGKRKWELYFQSAANVDDDDVFDETKWSPLYNVLISKLLVYDLILKAAEGSMAAFMAAAASFNASKVKIISGTVQVADYTVDFTVTAPFTIQAIIIDGLTYTNNTPMANLTAVLAWLNSLGLGVFQASGSNIVSLGNSHVVTTFNFTATEGGVNSAFVQSNVRVVSTTQAAGSSSGSTGGLFKGPVKSIKSGPAEAQWYDGSAFWASIFKSMGTGGLAGGQGGIFAALVQDICLYARKVGVQFGFCGPGPKRVRPFIIARGYCRQLKYDSRFIDIDPTRFNSPNWTDQQW